MEPPFGLHLVLMIYLWAAPSTDDIGYEVLIDRLNGPPYLSTELRKLLLWLTLACFSRKFVQKQRLIGLASRIDSFSQKRSKWAWFCHQVGVASKIRVRNCTSGTPLQEILDPPLLASRIVSQTQNLPIISAVRRQSACGTMDNMRVCRWTGEGLMHAHLEGVGLKHDL